MLSDHSAHTACTLPCSLLAFGEICLFSSFLQQMNSVEPTRVACFAGVFPFRPSMNDNEMVTPISFK